MGLPGVEVEGHVACVVNRRVASKMLEQLGCLVDVAPDGGQALAALESTSYDLVLMDCQMPEMDGLAATQTIWIREGSGRRTPIVAMTANAMAGDRERCLDSGMDGYLTKPVRPDELAATIAQWLTPSGANVAVDPPSRHRPTKVDGVPESSAGANGPSPIDRAQLALLRTVGGADGSEFVVRLVQAFIDEGRVELLQIRAAVADNAPKDLLHGAHRLKGSALNLGCIALADIAAELESIGHRGTVEGADALLARLDRDFDRTAVELQIEADAA